jgi:hypothetical protein
MGNEQLPHDEPPFEISHEQEAVDWRQAHEDLSRLARARAHLDWEEGRSLLRALRAGAQVHLGFASFAEYVERFFGYRPRWTEERLRVAEALEGLPELAQSLSRWRPELVGRARAHARGECRE